MIISVSALLPSKCDTQAQKKTCAVGAQFMCSMPSGRHRHPWKLDPRVCARFAGPAPHGIITFRISNESSTPLRLRRGRRLLVMATQRIVGLDFKGKRSCGFAMSVHRTMPRGTQSLSVNRIVAKNNPPRRLTKVAADERAC
jgi:hypothetical protein